MIRFPIYRENRPQAAPPAYNGDRFEEMALEQENNLGYYDPPTPNIIAIILGMLIFFLLGLFMYIFFLYGQSTIKCENTIDCIITSAGKKPTTLTLHGSIITALANPNTNNPPKEQPSTTSSTNKNEQSRFATFKTNKIEKRPHEKILTEKREFTTPTTSNIRRSPLQKFVNKGNGFNGIWGPFEDLDLDYDYEDGGAEGSGGVEYI